MAQSATMPRAKSEKDASVTIALPGSWLEEAEEILKARPSEPGLMLTRADILRMAIRRGLDSLAADQAKPSRKR